MPKDELYGALGARTAIRTRFAYSGVRGIRVTLWVRVRVVKQRDQMAVWVRVEDKVR